LDAGPEPATDAPGHQLTWIDQLPQQPMWVHADPQRLQQIWINLLTNACKYNRSGGHITVSTSEVPNGIRIEEGLIGGEDLILRPPPELKDGMKIRRKGQ
jgi:hypothetical protein